jgi:hypothetical protein
LIRSSLTPPPAGLQSPKFPAVRRSSLAAIRACACLSGSDSSHDLNIFWLSCYYRTFEDHAQTLFRTQSTPGDSICTCHESGLLGSTHVTSIKSASRLVDLKDERLGLRAAVARRTPRLLEAWTWPSVER